MKPNHPKMGEPRPTKTQESFHPESQSPRPRGRWWASQKTATAAPMASIWDRSTWGCDMPSVASSLPHDGWNKNEHYNEFFFPWIFGIFYGRFFTNFLPWASLSLHGRVKSYDKAQLLSFNTCWPSCPFQTCWGWSQIIIKLINAHQAQRMTNFCTQSQGKAHIPSPVGTPQVSLGGLSPPRTDEVPSPHGAWHIFVQENRKGN